MTDDRNPQCLHMFLSHAWNDKSLARRVARRLSSRGCSVWVDDERIQPGDALPKSVEAAIRSSTHVLVLLTESSIASKWVAREIDCARSMDGIPIVPLIGSEGITSPLLDETLGVKIFDTTRLEDALDALLKRSTPNAPATDRDESAMLRHVAAIGDENPLLSSVDLTTYDAKHLLETITPEQLSLHDAETFLALHYDLALLGDVDSAKLTRLACNVGVLFRALGAGFYALKRFVDCCEDHIAAHHVFTVFTRERLADPKLISAVQRLFDICRPPHHTVLKWFVCRELARLSEPERRWAVSHFVERAFEPAYDAIITAFIFLKSMPTEQSLINLWDRWMVGGKIGFEMGNLHSDEVKIYIRQMNGAIADGLRQFEPSMKQFLWHFRSLARGRTFPELTAAAEILRIAKHERYARLQDLFDEFAGALSSAEWNSLGLAPATTAAFRDFAHALEQGENDVDALLQLQSQAAPTAQLIAYCSDGSAAVRLQAVLQNELIDDQVTEAGAAVVVRGASAHSKDLAARLRSEGYKVLMV